MSGKNVEYLIEIVDKCPDYDNKKFTAYYVVDIYDFIEGYFLSGYKDIYFREGGDDEPTWVEIDETPWSISTVQIINICSIKPFIERIKSHEPELFI